MYSPAFSAIFELILSHNARIAPSNKFKNSSKMQAQNCGTYSFNITYHYLMGTAVVDFTFPMTNTLFKLPKQCIFPKVFSIKS